MIEGDSEIKTPEDDKTKKIDDLKQRAKASMLKLKHKREDESNVEDEKDSKKRAIEDIISEEKSNEGEIQKNENPENNINNINNVSNVINENFEMKSEEDNKQSKEIEEEISDFKKSNEIIEKNTPTITTPTITTPTIITPDPNIIPSITPTGSTTNPINPSNVSVQKEEAQGKAKKISFSEAKKEIEEFTAQLEKYEQEIKTKYGVNLSEFYVEDLLPEELKIKLIEDFFNSEEINELSKKLI